MAFGEKEEIQRDHAAEWMIVKNKEGKRIMDPEMNKEIIADHYEDLYAIKETPFHQYHQIVEDKIISLSQETSFNPQLDMVPTREEIKTAIKNKKNNKATTDWKNEVLKQGGDPMVDMILPVIMSSGMRNGHPSCGMRES